MSIKNYFSMVCIAILLSSCVKSTTAVFELSNRTSKNCKVTFYTNSSIADEYSVNANSDIQTNYKIIVEGGDIYFELIEDSVLIEFNTGKSVKFYKHKSSQTDDRTIYNEKYWEKEEISKRSIKYIFPILEEDLN